MAGSIPAIKIKGPGFASVISSALGGVGKGLKEAAEFKLAYDKLESEKKEGVARTKLLTSQSVKTRMDVVTSGLEQLQKLQDRGAPPEVMTKAVDGFMTFLSADDIPVDRSMLEFVTKTPGAFALTADFLKTGDTKGESFAKLMQLNPQMATSLHNIMLQEARIHAGKDLLAEADQMVKSGTAKTPEEALRTMHEQGRFTMAELRAGGKVDVTTPPDPRDRQIKDLQIKALEEDIRLAPKKAEIVDAQLNKLQAEVDKIKNDPVSMTELRSSAFGVAAKMMRGIQEKNDKMAFLSPEEQVKWGHLNSDWLMQFAKSESPGDLLTALVSALAERFVKEGAARRGEPAPTAGSSPTAPERGAAPPKDTSGKPKPTVTRIR